MLSEVFGQEKLVLLYRFSMEIEKAKNCLDLNVRAQADVGDHIVPSVDNQVLVAPEIINGIPTNAINGFGATSDNGNHIFTINISSQQPTKHTNVFVNSRFSCLCVEKHKLTCNVRGFEGRL